MTVALKINSPCQRSRGVDQPISIPIRAHVLGSEIAIRVVEWNLTSSAKAAFRILSGSASFGIQSVEQSKLSRECIVELGPNVRSVVCSGSDRWTFTLPTELKNPDRRYTARLVAQLPLKIGKLDESLLLHPVTNDGEKLTGIHLQISGEVVSDIISEPRQLCLGRQKIGSSSEDTFIIKSLSGRSIAVKSTSDEICIVKELKRREDGSIQFQIVATAKREVEQLIRLSFIVSGADGKCDQTIYIPVNYFGY